MHSRLVAMKHGKSLHTAWLYFGRSLHGTGDSNDNSNNSSSSTSVNSGKYYRNVSSSSPTWSLDKSGVKLTASTPNIVEGFQGREHEFSQHRAHDILDRGNEHGENSDSVNKNAVYQDDVVEESVKKGGKYFGSVESLENDMVEAYGDPGVSLNGVMQSNVPEPFNPHGRNPTHLNMPGGGILSKDKYLNDNIIKNHPSKNFSTCSMAQAKHEKDDGQGHLQDVNFSQGPQDLTFEMAHGKHMEYDDYGHLLQDVNFSCVPTSGGGLELQGPQDSHKYLTMDYLMSFQDPCPEGVQGEDCEQFKKWLNNSAKYRFTNCAHQQQGVQDGCMVVSKIFKEQQQLISIPAQRRRYSTPASPSKSGGKQEEVSGKSSPQVQLTQRQKLQRTVKDYGATVVVFHIGISLMSLGGFYLAVSR